MTAPADDNLEQLRTVDEADVYKAGRLAATLRRTEAGVEFRYLPDWVEAAEAPVATSLPLTGEPVVRAGGSVPAYFTGLLPEGRRLGALRRAVKILPNQLRRLTRVVLLAVPLLPFTVVVFCVALT